MDPNATVKLICDAFNDYRATGSLESLSEAIVHAEDLVEWLDKSGFQPDMAHLLIIPLLNAMNELVEHA